MMHKPRRISKGCKREHRSDMSATVATLCTGARYIEEMPKPKSSKNQVIVVPQSRHLTDSVQVVTLPTRSPRRSVNSNTGGPSCSNLSDASKHAFQAFELWPFSFDAFLHCILRASRTRHSSCIHPMHSLTLHPSSVLSGFSGVLQLQTVRRV